MGDFNEIIAQIEKVSGSARLGGFIDTFREAALVSKLVDLGFFGYHYM